MNHPGILLAVDELADDGHELILPFPAPAPEPEPYDLDRAAVIKRIKAGLKRRSGKEWSVTGGRGTAYGWLNIIAPKKRCTWRTVQTRTPEPPTPDAIYCGMSCVTPSDRVSVYAPDRIESPRDDPWARTAEERGCAMPYNWDVNVPDDPTGFMGRADCADLAELLGLNSPVHFQGQQVADSNAHYREYIDRAEGRTPGAYGTRYWD